MNIVTGYRGEPHITAQEDRDFNTGLVGPSTTSTYVLNVGNKLAAEIVSANEIRVKDGVAVFQGCVGIIEYGTYDSIEISNGSQGMLRTDVIALQYEKDSETNVESLSLVVIEGTPAASDPVTPSVTSGNIAAGDSLVQAPLYNVNIDGIAIDSVTARFTTLSNSISSIVSTAVTSSELTTGTSTSKRVITPKVIHDYFMGITSATDTWNGCDINYTKYGRVVTIRIYGTTTNQITSTNGGELTIKTIPSAYRPRIQYVSRTWITATIEGQVIANNSGDLKLAYTQNISGTSATGTNIPASSTVRIEMCYISAS